ncbi:MAG: PRC-barrel domain containing protein [Sulfitobacter sp.]|nr:PRC-barrel domain containing protein [Sulfitobacter sp.]
MEYTKHSRLHPDDLKAALVEGAEVYGANDDLVGEISLFLGIGTSGKAIVDVGTFLGFSDAKMVTIPVSRMTFFMCVKDDEIHAKTSLTKEEIQLLAGTNQYTR